MESIVGGVAELLAEMYEKEGNFEAVALQLRKVIAQNKKEFTQDLNNHISILSAEQKNISLKKDAEIHRLKSVELKEKSRALEQTIVELKETQQQLIYQEKMAALGGLIAGIAHEINTPFAVIQAAVQNVNKYAGQVISLDYPNLLLRLEPDTRASFIKLIKEASKPHELLSTSEERGIRLKLAKDLESRGVERAMKVADWLMDMHIHDVNEDILIILGSPEREGIMKVSYELSGIMRNLVNIQRAVIKGSKTVFALKNYTHFGSAKELTLIDPLEEIKTILQLYENQIKNKVELSWDAPKPVLIEGMPDELNQVWMNLIHNALLQAMSFSGKLGISSIEREEGLEIRITDSGCGIEPENADRIFEAFFTTKQQGVGSGLGLHIVKRIIEKHHGNITFTSRPGETTFSVLLPKRQPNEESQH